MKLEIDLGNIGGDANEPSVPKGPRPSHLDEVMSRALESQRGIEIEFGSRKEVEAARFRFYRRIRELRKFNIKSFDKIAFSIEGNALRLLPLPDLESKIKEL